MDSFDSGDKDEERGFEQPEQRPGKSADKKRKFELFVMLWWSGLLVCLLGLIGALATSDLATVKLGEDAVFYVVSGVLLLPIVQVVSLFLAPLGCFGLSNAKIYGFFRFCSRKGPSTFRLQKLRV